MLIESKEIYKNDGTTLLFNILGDGIDCNSATDLTLEVIDNSDNSIIFSKEFAQFTIVSENSVSCNIFSTDTNINAKSYKAKFKITFSASSSQTKIFNLNILDC